jgi:DNA-binding beta-propeller fold protein YncE
LTAALVLAASPARAAVYDRIDTIPVPGLTSFDISWVDPDTETYYLADRTTVPGGGRIDVVDAATHDLRKPITGFVGNQGAGRSGPNGIVVLPGSHELYAGDGDSSVKVVDLDAGQVVKRIPTGGSKRADELAFDPDHHLMLVANDADTPPFVTFISTDTRTVVGRIDYPQALDGLEQPVYDPRSQLFFLAVPETTANHGGEIDAIDPDSMTIDHVFSLDDCAPHGLTLGPRHRLLVGCSKQRTIVLGARTGRVIANLTEIGGSDEVWFNPGDNRYYLAASNHLPNPILGVIDARHNRVIDTIPTAVGAHSVAVNPNNNHVFVPTRAGNILVFAAAEDAVPDNGDDGDPGDD